MSTEDSRFEYPLEFVKQHVLGCFEASKACALLPGKPHLYHVEFLKRDGLDDQLPSNLPVDFFLEAHCSPCEEVSWYLHTRENRPVFEGSSEPDHKFVEDNAAGNLTYMTEVAKQQLKNMLSMLDHTVPPTPENPEESVTDTFTDTFGCNACAVVNSELPHSRSCKARRSRFDKINKELGGGISGV